MMHKLLRLLLLATVAGLSPTGHAQEAEPAGETPVAVESPAEQAPEDTAEKTRAPAPPPEEFEPSEQISEDLSVSFPVDI
jgi:hypothetical protein